MRTGCSMVGLRKPKYEPINVNGTLMQNHIARRATSVENGTAADDPLLHRRMFMQKKQAKMTPGQSVAVSSTCDFHATPPNILYILADI